MIFKSWTIVKNIENDECEFMEHLGFATLMSVFSNFPHSSVCLCTPLLSLSMWRQGVVR